jgi:hypothetical protein
VFIGADHDVDVAMSIAAVSLTAFLALSHSSTQNPQQKYDIFFELTNLSVTRIICSFESVDHNNQLDFPTVRSTDFTACRSLTDSFYNIGVHTNTNKLTCDIYIEVMVDSPTVIREASHGGLLNDPSRLIYIFC